MILNVLFLFCFLYNDQLPVTITPRDSVIPEKSVTCDKPSICGTLIAACGDIRAILGSQGKNIAVCQHGDAIAVIYGAPTGVPNNPMAVKIAYSTDQGATWISWGPFAGNCRRTTPGCDGTPDFCTTPGCVFCHMMYASPGYPFPEHVLIEENVPSNSMISAPVTPYWSDSFYIWQTGIAIAPDDPMKMITHGWSFLSNGDNHLYCWVSTDGGFTWPTPIDMGVTGLCGPKLRWGTGGYVGGIYINSVGGINDGWPFFIESTDNGVTWLPPVQLPVPHFDSTVGIFSGAEIDAEVVNNEPWVLANDIGSSHMWLFIGDGSPGAHSWQVYDMTVVGACSISVADTLCIMKPSQYGSICHDPISGMTLITYKCYGLIQDSNNIYQDSACVGGVFTMDGGNTWKITKPLSVYQTSIPWMDWGATETAHRLANIGGGIYAYTIWINSANFNLYFEGGTTNNGRVTPIWPNVAEASLSIPRIPMKLTPTINRGLCRIEFTSVTPAITDLTLFDVTGRQIANLFNGWLTAGPHIILADIRHLPAGAYFVRLQSGAGSAIEKILLVR